MIHVWMLYSIVQYLLLFLMFIVIECEETVSMMSFDCVSEASSEVSMPTS